MSSDDTNSQDSSIGEQTSRTDTKDNTERSVKDVNEAVPNCGGCTEAWEALSSLRSDNEPTRRTVLREIAAVGSGASLASLGIAGTSRAAAESGESLKVESVSEQKERSLVRKSRSLDSFEELNEKFQQQGFGPAWNRSTASRRTLRGLSTASTSLHVPFTTEGSTEADGYVMFPDDGTTDVIGVIRRDSGAVERYWTTDSNQYKATDSKTASRLVKAPTTTASGDVATASGDMTTQGIFFGCGGPYNINDFCWILDLLAIAGTVVVQFVPVPGDEPVALGTIAEVLTGSCVAIETMKRLTPCDFDKVKICHAGTALYVKPACVYNS